MSVMRYVKVGLFFISLGVAGSGYVIMSTDGFNRFNTKDYEVIMADATGLSTNSKVYLAGVPVGKIRAIDLSGDQALLTVSFLKDVEIRGGSTVARKSSSILGTSILALTPGDEQNEVLKPGGRIQPTDGETSMTALLGSTQDLSAQISAMIREFQENQMKLLAVSLETFNSIAIKLDQRSDAELDRVSRILESTALITERMDRILAEREGDIGSSASDIAAALANLRAITDEIRGGQGNLGKTLYDDGLYDNLLKTAEETSVAAAKLQEALDSVNRLAVNADTVVRDAGSIVSKANGLGVQVNAAGRYGVLSSGFRGGASLRLEPRSNDRWYRVGVNDSPDGNQTRTVTETTGTSGTTREETVETDYGVTIDAELARKLGAFTLRGGLLESTPGFGLDFAPASWISLSGEAFSFGGGDLPNLRGTVTLYPFFDPWSNKPWNWLYLTGGISDALGAKRDYFFGAGLRFADEEIRGLVGLVPIAAK